ncbi:hypothetical protein [uncultured Kiloniella sp.]|uniref:hypothetical protein n=1 Tax=uncultured Kiloniella sp. TaxID=1133091 RepID=UPI0026045D59|nr:hypothetical protein [uncultured Kiloniella sp.]
MTFVLRILGWVFLAIALASLAFDLFPLMEQGSFQLSLLGENWFAVHPGSLNLLQAVTERYIGLWLWDDVFSPLLFLPTLVFGLVAAVIFLIPGYLFKNSRRRRRR